VPTDDPAIPKMSFFTLLRRPRAKRPRVLAIGTLAVYGRVQNGPLVLARADLQRMPAEDHTPDVSAYAKGEAGNALRLKAIFDLARPVPGTLYMNFGNRSGGQRVSHFLAEVQELGWIAYTADGEVSPGEQGGAFRLILPGLPTGQRRMNDLAWIEFGDEPADGGTPAEKLRSRVGDPRP
jgi:DMSO/TMAO reductase YedYZ molybdopterin-dependent catalytic subunit